jgi:predicted AlkP superfamily phosphohydrolase/phosphomutase
VRHLRLLLNALIAGGVFASYMTLLVLQLNPTVTLTPGPVAALAASLVTYYGLGLALLFYLVLMVRHLFAEQVFSPGWVSFQVLVWLCLVAAGAGAALMWLNLSALRVTLDDEAARRMALGAGTLTICVALLLALGVFRFSVGRGGRAGPAAFGLVLLISIASPLVARGPAATVSPDRREPAGPFFAASPAGRVTLVVLEGASLDFISPAVADGRLPNFGRVLDGGAVMHLATLRPTQPAPVLTAVATGKLPMRTGVRSAALYRVRPAGPLVEVLPDYCFAHGLVALGLLREAPHTSSSVRARPLWSILESSGISAAIVRWPLTYPASAGARAMVTDHLPSMARDASAVFPRSLRERLHTTASQPEAASVAASLVARGAPPFAGAGELALDRLYSEAFDVVVRAADARLGAIRYTGVDAVGHEYLRQAMPRAFGDVREDERRQFGSVLEQYYRYLDGEIGRYLERLDPDDLLLVVSPFGMEPLSPPKRWLEGALGNRDSGTHERAPDGFLLAYGSPVRAGRLRRASVLDVTPTILYFFGLPIGRDMDGYARTEIFTRAFTAGRPLVFIPTYER